MKIYKCYLLLFAVCFSTFLLTAQDSLKTINLSQYLDQNEVQATLSDYGVYYEITQPGSGRMPKVGDYLALQFKGKLLDETVFQQSDSDDPFVFQVGYRQVIKGWDLGIRHFPLGSKGNIYIPASLAYGKRGAGKEIPPNAPLKFEVEVLKVLTEAEYDIYMEELEAKERAAYEASIEEQFIADKKIIQEYALSHKLRTKRTDSGLSYVITKKGRGEPARAGDELEVIYEGMLANDQPFDSNVGKEVFKFPLGRNKVIKGWEEGLTYFSEGSEGILLIPSKLAYGPRGIYEKNISIPAHSVLIFKIKVEKIIREAVE